jgi:ABC-type transport system involved in multi-copper enzyme maturation permease subunit
MVLLPVVEREMRVAARGRAMYRVRFWAVLVMACIFGWNMLSLGQNWTPTQAGVQVLGFLTLWGFLFSLIIGVIATSDSVSREKREGTLGLLFLTDLKGYDVICGKLAANSANALYALVATLPILGIPLLMGGITFGQFCKLALVLVTTMVLSLAVGIFVSTYSRHERKAMVFTILILLGLTFFFPFVVSILVDNAAPLSMPDSVWLGMMFSPGYGIIQTIARVPFPPVSYSFSILWQWLVAAALIARACAHVPHSWEESGPARNPFRGFFKFRLIRRPGNGSPRRWLEKNPFLWLALRDEAGRGRVWLFVASIFLVWLLAALKYGLSFAMDEGFLLVLTAILHWPLRIWIASEASRRFVDDRNNNTFEFLLSTPLTERQIIGGQWLSLWHQFAGPLAGVMAGECFIANYQRHHHAWAWEGLASPLLGVFFLVFDAVSLGWVGMWLGLVCPGRTKAILGSLALVVMVPWVLYLVYFVVDVALYRYVDSGMGYLPRLDFATIIRVCYCVLMNGTAIFWIRSRLPKELRRLASAR